MPCGEVPALVLLWLSVAGRPHELFILSGVGYGDTEVQLDGGGLCKLLNQNLN